MEHTFEKISRDQWPSIRLTHHMCAVLLMRRLLYFSIHPHHPWNKRSASQQTVCRLDNVAMRDVSPCSTGMSCNNVYTQLSNPFATYTYTSYQLINQHHGALQYQPGKCTRNTNSISIPQRLAIQTNPTDSSSKNRTTTSTAHPTSLHP